MKRRLIILATMLVVLFVLSLPTPRPVSAFGFCENCGQSCWNEANTGENNTLYWQCRDNNSQSYCDQHVTNAYYNGCIAADCNNAGCNLAPKND